MTTTKTSTVRRRRRGWLITLLIGLGLAIAPVLSYARAVTAPGQATLGVRSVDWLRDHGGSPLVNLVENTYYTLNAPADRAPDPTTLPPVPARIAVAARAAIPAAVAPAAVLPLLPGQPALPGEATWYPHPLDASGTPAVYTGYLRPDPQHRSVVAGVAWIRSSQVRAHLVAGTTQPTPDPTRAAAIPGGDVPRLVATFNSGWRMKDTAGGFVLDGHTLVPLIDGGATAAIDDSGKLSVGAWGRDLHPGRHLVAARQNLMLIVAHGHLSAGLEANRSGQWGSPKSQFQYTGRSALGVDARGNLIYLAGDGLTLHTLASALLASGAVEGMELDIHNGMQIFSMWRPAMPDPRSAAPTSTPSPTKLLPSMEPPADRYLQQDQRDFFYLTASR